MKYCEVDNCRYPHSHVTSGHRCGKCYQYGHGFIECGDLDKINNLKNNYHYQRLPYKLWCKKNGCRYFWSHNCRAHHCNNCGNNHSQIDCPISNNNTVNNNNHSFRHRHPADRSDRESLPDRGSCGKVARKLRPPNGTVSKRPWLPYDKRFDTTAQTAGGRGRGGETGICMCVCV